MKTALPTPPPPRLKIFAAVARWALRILAFAWITLGLVWGGLHFVIVPRIGELRPWLEQQASQRLGSTVRIGAIMAKSNGLIPSVELQDVRILDSVGREALHLPTVLAALSPRSAMGGGFEQLYIERPVLDVRRSADGRIWIAGLLLSATSSDGGAVQDWLFSQTELAVRHGSLRWTDEMRGVAPLELQDVDIVLRNRGRAHSVRVDADPPSGWGARLTLMGKFQQPLFTTRRGDWKAWSGQLFAEATQVDLAQLRNYLDLGVDLRQGAGAARAWVDVDQQKLTAATADIALQQVVLQASPHLDVLNLDRISGRIGVKKLQDGYEYSTESLAFDTHEGQHWPGGNLVLRLSPGDTEASSQGTLTADRLDLAAMADIANRLPLDAGTRARLVSVAPQGLVQTLLYHWQGPLEKPASFSAIGRVVQLGLKAQPDGNAGIPGVRGADLKFDFNQKQGHVSVALKNGALDFPGIFEKSEVALDHLSGELNWKRDGAHISVDLSQLQFQNAEAQGEAHLKWQTAEVPRGGPADLRFPGVLDLQGSLSRADVVAVPRYLPRVMNRDAREYLQHALLGGVGSNVRFKVRGDLSKFPFADARVGDFHISAQVQNASYAYAPVSVMPKDSPPWPLLTQVSGEFVIDHDTLQVQGARGLAAPATGLLFARTDATITKLYTEPVINVGAEVHGPLADALGVVNSSPIGVWTGKALAHATVTGAAEYRFKLSIPLDHMDKSTVQGNVNLPGNDFQFGPGVPRLTRARGVLAFSESGFTVPGIQARALGGEVRVDGGMSVLNATSVPPIAHNTPTALRLQGVASAEGLRQAQELGPLARLAPYLSGSAPFVVTVSLRAGFPELQISSPLTGMAVTLPEPFSKPAESALLLHLENTAVRSSQMPGARLQDQWQLEIGQRTSVSYVRDIAGPDARVLRGAIGVGLAGDESVPLPADGVVANVHADQLDVDAWGAVAARLGGGSPGAVPAQLSPALMSYLPTSLTVRAAEMTVGGHKINHVVVGGGREGTVWRANVDAPEINGYVEYRQPSGAAPGRVYARLAHLVIGQSAEQDVANLLDQQPASIPALDIVVNDMELRGKRLGRVEILAVNMGSGAPRDATREWRLNRFNISTPEATLTATGSWANVAAAPGTVARSVRERRRTDLNFKLDIADSGEMFRRAGMPGVLAKGHGKVEGQVAWLGSPFSPDYASMTGGFNVNVETGQFLKAEPGIAKLLGVLSLQSLPRRLVLDFRDVFSDGFAFDFVRGDVAIAQGIARTNNLQMKGVNAAVMMEGQADIDKETQQIKVVVIPEINAGSASLLASTINPLVGLTTFLAQVILRKPLMDANTQEFQIDGTWVDPRVTKVEHP
jgi:uncharacterized protein (TIGR02099 family)